MNISENHNFEIEEKCVGKNTKEIKFKHSHLSENAKILKEIKEKMSKGK
jgi:hypothetical protein